MPRLNGPGATKTLRQMGCRCAIIGVSGNVLPEDIKHFTDHGANAVLGKPLSLAALEDIWRRVASAPWQPTPGTELHRNLTAAATSYRAVRK